MKYIVFIIFSVLICLIFCLPIILFKFLFSFKLSSNGCVDIFAGLAELLDINE